MRLLYLTLALLAGCAPLPSEVTLAGQFIWNGGDEGFGGISGLEVIDGGTRYVALNDKGLIRTGPILREDGEIIAMPIETRYRLKRPDGRRVNKEFSDSEGLAIGIDGLTYVSFEGETRVAVYGDTTDPAAQELVHPEFEKLSGNASLESLAIGPDGGLFAIPERSGRANRPFPVYRYREGAGWDIPFRLPRRGAFLIVGADVGPDGLLYVLERDFTGAGFRSRVRRFDLTGADETVLLQTANAAHDNLEGISVWQDPQRGLIMTLVSDDNFQFFQQTEVIEYRIDR